MVTLSISLEYWLSIPEFGRPLRGQVEVSKWGIRGVLLPCVGTRSSEDTIRNERWPAALDRFV